MKKRILSLFLAILMVCTLLPVSAFAATVVHSGTDGNITWSLDSNGLLTITGEGSIGDYEDDDVPWEDHISDVKSVRLGSGITDIGSYTFLRHNNLASFSIEDGSEAFSVIDGVLFNKDKTALILYPSGRTVTSYTIPDGVTIIATYAFCGTRGSLEELNTNDVKSFSKYSLYNVNCKITVPETITDLDNYAFMYSGITEASVSVSSIPKGAFSNSKLEKIFLLSTLSYIGENAFFVSGLKQVYYVGSNLAQVTSMQRGNSELREVYNNNPRGYCGVNLLWSFDPASGTLTISGTGAMKDYSSQYYSGTYATSAPWGQYYASIKSVVIEDGVTRIGNSAFAYCSGLTSVTIPDSVTSIGSSAFDGTALDNNSSNWENGVLYIGKYLINAKTDITSCTVKAGTLCIADSAFNRCSSLTSVTIPDSVTSIGSDAFSACIGITSVDIPDSVTSIGDEAFYYCSSLTSVTIPDNVTSIGSAAFYYCYGLASAKFEGNAPTTFGTNVFGSCADGFKILAPDNSTWKGEAYDAEAGTWNGYPIEFYRAAEIIASGTCGTDLAWTLDSDGVLTISGTGAMRNYYYSPSYAPWYSNRSTIVSVVIGDGVTSIGNYAFYYCHSLTSVEIPDSVTSIGSDAFYNCSGLTSVTIPDSVTSIGERAFCNCSGLTSVTIPDGVQSIDSDAFYNCSGLTSVTIPDSVTSIGGQAFRDCSALTSVTIPDSVTSIGERAFRDCSALTSVTIGSSVESIGSSAFDGCSGLTSVYIHDLAAWCGISFNISANPLCYAHDLYCNGEKVTDLVIPDSVTSIGERAFYNCRGLTSVTIPDGVQSIGSDAFYNCSGLTSVTIPDGVTSIGNSAFYNCSGLTSVTIPNGVTSIGSDAFYNCSNLSHIYFKGSLPTIGSNAFSCNSSSNYVRAFAFYPDGDESYANAGTYGASELVWLPDGDPEEMIWSGDCGENIVWRLTRSGTLKLSGSGKMYGYTAATQPWKDISFGITGVEISDGIESIGSYAFRGCTRLTDVTIPDSVTSIGMYAFYGCSGLTSVTIPDSVTSIGENAFAGCSSLTSVTIPSSVTSIGNAAFSGCSGLTSVTIPDSVTSIGGHAFRDCSGLTSVTIPDSVTSISYSAFYGCSGLTSVTFEGKPNSIYSSAFEGVTATAYYYLEDNWPADMLRDYDGKLTWKMLTRHSLDSENLTVLPESVHDYPANYSEKFEIAEDGAVYLTLKFSAETSLGTNDILFVVDQNGKTVATYSGSEAAGQTLVVDGGKATIWINADDVGSGYGFKLDSVKVDYLHHDYSDVVTAPTCTEQGYTTRTCEFCGAVSVGSYVDALGHNFVDGICTRCHTLEVADSGSCGSYAKWTLGTNGVLTVTGSGSVTSSPWRTNHAADIKSVVIGKDITSLCNNAFSGCTNLSSATFEGKAVSLGGSSVFYNCASDFAITATKGDVSWTRSGAYNEQDGTWNGYKIVFVGGHDHAYSEVITLEPTCTEVGYKTRTCAVCGDVEIIPISARGHVYDIVVTDPCCTKGGYTTYSCKYCDYSYEGDYIIATGHNFNESVIAVTCTTAGYTLHTCSCGVFYTSDYVEATGHSYTTVVTAPTCTEQGYTTYTCTCGDTYVGNIVKATGHSYTDSVTAPTCKKMGFTTHTCACGFSYIDTYTDTTSHDFGDWVLTVQPSCIQTGIETRTCKDCGFLEMHDTGVFGSHVTNLVGAVAATCGSAGYTGDEVCEICENVVTAGEQIEPCAHAWGEVVYTWAEDGSSCTASRVCGNDETHTETAEAVITSEVTTPATCTKMGTTTYTATFDKEWAVTQSLPIANIAKLPHTYSEPVFKWNGYNCTATVSCSCGDTQPVECTVTSAVTKEATTKAEGVRTYTATVTIDGHTYTSTKTESIPKIDDGGSSDNCFTKFIKAIKGAVDSIINSIFSIFKFK